MTDEMHEPPRNTEQYDGGCRCTVHDDNNALIALSKC